MKKNTIFITVLIVVLIALIAILTSRVLDINEKKMGIIENNVKDSKNLVINDEILDIEVSSNSELNHTVNIKNEISSSFNSSEEVEEKADINNSSEKVSVNTDEINEIIEQFDTFINDFDELDTTVLNDEEKEEFNTIKKEIKDVREKMNSLIGKNSVDKDEFEVLMKKVNNVRNDCTNFSTKLAEDLFKDSQEATKEVKEALEKEMDVENSSINVNGKEFKDLSEYIETIRGNN